jgi:hypothetical protein
MDKSNTKHKQRQITTKYITKDLSPIYNSDMSEYLDITHVGLWYIVFNICDKSGKILDENIRREVFIDEEGIEYIKNLEYNTYTRTLTPNKIILIQ